LVRPFTEFLDTYDRVWFAELPAQDEVAFEGDVFLLAKEKARRLKAGLVPPPVIPPQPDTVVPEPIGPSPQPVSEVKTLRVFGTMPPEVWKSSWRKTPTKAPVGNGAKSGR
jgi:hypothetical protein